MKVYITKARELKTLIEQLEANPDLIVKDNSSHLQQILALANEVGDIRGYSITNINVTQDVHSFSATHFGGTYILRSSQESTLKIKRPGRKARRNASLEEGPTYVISDQESTMSGVVYIPISDTAQVIEFLLSKVKMPKLYAQLLDIRRTKDRGYGFDEAGVSGAEAIVPLLSADDPVIGQLLTQLWPYDYKRTARCDPSRLETMFRKENKNTQDYIIHILKTEGEDYAS